MSATTERCPAYSPFFGVMGATSAMVFTGKFQLDTVGLGGRRWEILRLFWFYFEALGASYGTAKAGVGISAAAVLKPEFIMKSVIPVVMAGIIAIYGLVVAVIITGKIGQQYTLLA